MIKVSFQSINKEHFYRNVFELKKRLLKCLLKRNKLTYVMKLIIFSS